MNYHINNTWNTLQLAKLQVLTAVLLGVRPSGTWRLVTGRVILDVSKKRSDFV